MKSNSLLVLIFVTALANAGDIIDLKSEQQLPQANRIIFSAIPYSTIATNLTTEAQKSCPSGFEKVREYAAPEGDAWYLHFVIRCLPPATPAPSASTQPR